MNYVPENEVFVAKSTKLRATFDGAREIKSKVKITKNAILIRTSINLMIYVNNCCRGK